MGAIQAHWARIHIICYFPNIYIISNINIVVYFMFESRRNGGAKTHLLTVYLTAPSVAKAVLQTHLSLINSLIHSRMLFLWSSKHQYTQTVRARELIFWYNVHHSPHVTCQVPCFTYQVSCTAVQSWENLQKLQH